MPPPLQMRILILGSGAGGGFPQWNCACSNCRRLREGTFLGKPRTQSSIAVSADGERWLLFNASPDLRIQIERTPALWPREGVRHSPIQAILLIDAQIDHTTGLLILRESRKPLEVYCTDPVYRDLTTGFPIFKVLDHYCGVRRHPVPLDGSRFQIPELPGLRLAAHALISKAPPYSPDRDHPQLGDNIGVLVEEVATGRKLYYAPGLGEIEPHVWEAMQQADAVLVDGTFWSDDELIRTVGVNKRAREIGHLPVSEMVEYLSRLPDETRKVLIHINNTNPILDETSPERRAVEESGVEVAYDGMEIEL